MGYFRTWDLNDEQLETNRQYLEKMLSEYPDDDSGAAWQEMLNVVETEQDFRASPSGDTDRQRTVAWCEYLEVVSKLPHGPRGSALSDRQ